MINRVLTNRKSSAWRLIVVLTILTMGGCPCSTGAAPLPDLIPNAYRIKLSLEVKKRFIPQDNCAFVEGCLRGFSNPKLLLFDTGVANVGKADLVIGDPLLRPNLFRFSPCHSHYHLNAFARYRLFTRQWRLVVKASKQGFCLRDDRRYFSTAGAARGYTCDYQGISR